MNNEKGYRSMDEAIAAFCRASGINGEAINMVDVERVGRKRLNICSEVLVSLYAISIGDTWYANIGLHEGNGWHILLYDKGFRYCAPVSRNSLESMALSG